jgi:CRISPR/Cas system-associated exonuclease Cas4 (RecB family)
MKTSHDGFDTNRGTMTNVTLKEKEVNKREDREPHFSFSQMNMWMRCGWQYYLRYILGKIDPPSIPLNSGKAIHQSLEYNGLHKLKTKEDMALADLLDIQSDAHDKYMSSLEGANKKDVGEDKDLSASILTVHRRVHAPAITPIAVEHSFRVELPDDEHGPYLPVIGFIDAISEVPDKRPGPTGGRIVALEDYKKVSMRKGQRDVDLSPQLTLYDYVYNLETERLTDVVGFRQLGFTKKEGPYSEPLYRTHLTEPKRRNRWKRVLNQLKQVQLAIQKGVFIPADDPKVCGWCGYKDICQFKAEE